MALLATVGCGSHDEPPLSIGTVGAHPVGQSVPTVAARTASLLKEPPLCPALGILPGLCCHDGHEIVCTASDQCHAAGTCDATTGQCSNPPVANGTSCDDGNACDLNDTCQSGTCTAGSTVTCTASDACHTAGTCNPANGACSNPQIPLPPPTSACSLSTCNPTAGAEPAGPIQFQCSPVDPTVASTVGSTTSFLYTGGGAIQTGVAAGTITPTRAAVIRGEVSDTSSNPLAGITVSVVGHPELGTTTTLTDGTFAMAVNGGGALVLAFNAARYLPVQRTVAQVPWNGYAFASDVAMTALDPQATPVNFGGTSSYQVARGTTQTDSSGSRTATLLVPPGTTASLVSGSTSTPASTLTFRATEYTVGANGPLAMPGDLPKNSAYTYAVELSADEALANGAEVEFSSPIISYTDNFLAFTAGEHVPVGYYNRTLGQWAPSPDGLVIAILGITSGVASIDITGTGVAASTTQLASVVPPITSAEQTQLATMYTAGTSLWRVAIPHFSAWDFNWPFAPPPGSTPPPGPPPFPPPTPPDACQSDSSSSPNASSIECQNGILHEEIPIAGTPYSLVYSSDRVVGYGAANHLVIPLSGASLPPDLVGISMEVEVAGTSFTPPDFPANPNQTTTFDWNGEDAFGRLVQGIQTATVSVGYVYQGVYLTPSENPLTSAYNAIFGHFSYYGTPATGDRTRQTVTLWSRNQVPIGHYSAEALGLGGWTLNVQHIYEPAAETLLLGDGRRQPGNAFGEIVTTFAGNGSPGDSGDGQPAVSAELNQPASVSVMPDGSVLIADTDSCRIRKVSPSGTITTVAGTSCGGYNGDNRLATTAVLNKPKSVFAAADGSFYIADTNNHGVRHVDLNGIITTSAGNGTPGSTGDGGPATSAELTYPGGLFLAPDGSLYIGEYTPACVVRKVDPAGLISTVAGTPGACGSTGDNGPAAQAKLGELQEVVVSPDGALYIADGVNNKIRVVGTNGIITTIAGTGTAGYSGDGGPATNAQLNVPLSMAWGPDGTLYFADQGNARVRAIRSDGTIYTVAGNGSVGSLGDNGPALDAEFGSPNWNFGLALSGDAQYMYIADGVNNRVRRLSLVQPGFADTAFGVASQDGSEVYEFDPYGRHLSTVSLPTNVPVVTFGYNSSQLVQSITDAYNNVTTIARNGNQTTIASPYRVTTTLTNGSDGYLKTVLGPAGAEYQMTYKTGGLLSTIEFPTGSSTVYSSKTYDSLGRVATSTDAAGHSLTFARQPDSPTEIQVTKTTGLNVATNFAIALPLDGGSTWTNTLPDTTTVLTQVGADGSRTVTAPDGTKTTYTPGPDPRFGMQAPVTASQTVVTPSGLTETSSTSRVVDLSDPANPLSLVSETDTTTINGHPWTTVFDAIAGNGGTVTSMTPEGRQTTTTLNVFGQPTNIAVPEIAASVLGYDTHGRPQTSTQGTFTVGSQSFPRTWTRGYDPNGYLNSSTDPMTVATTYINDRAGRPTDTFLPGGADGGTRDLKTGFDGDDNLTSVELPPDAGAASNALHQFTYTPVDAIQSYAPPSLGSGNWTTSYQYDGDGRIWIETRPDGSTITNGYDPTTGQLKTVTYPQGTLMRNYVPATGPVTGQLFSIASPSGETLTFTYDGFLNTGTTWTGTVAGALVIGYDSTFRMTSQSVNGVALPFGYDNDNLMTLAGAESLSPPTSPRDPLNGRITGTTLGGVSDSYGYDTNGQFASYVATYGGTTLYAETINTRDGDGRITERTESVIESGSLVTHVWAYTYDTAGRLWTVSEDGTEVSEYLYDSDDNRTTYMNATETVNPTYDAQDRLLSYGSVTYLYGRNGELQSKTSGAQTTGYVYDVFGNLLSASLPNGGGTLDYVVDGQNRRVGTQLNGVLKSGFLYQDQLNVVAQLDGNGNVVSRFVFGSKQNVPDYYTTSAGTFRILSDHIGSPRVIVNTANGSVVEEIDYDEFGNVTKDTSPGTIPFGFAGGLYDQNTGLVRFGARDYDPTTGRWTSKDPIRVAGGFNLYVYSQSDPVNMRDSDGLQSSDGGGDAGAGDSGAPAVCGGLPPWPANDNGKNCDFLRSSSSRNPGETLCWYKCPGIPEFSKVTYFGPEQCTNPDFWPAANPNRPYPPRPIPWPPSWWPSWLPPIFVFPPPIFAIP